MSSDVVSIESPKFVVYVVNRCNRTYLKAPMYLITLVITGKRAFLIATDRFGCSLQEPSINLK